MATTVTRMWGGALSITMLICSWTTSVAQATTYYVATGGNDRASGSREAPWQTLSRAVRQLRAGDTLIVRPGSYAGFRLRGENSGKAEARVRILAEDGAVIDRMYENAQDGINIEHASYIDIEGFRITNAPRAGIRAVECLGVRLRNNKAHDNGRWGIFSGFCDDLLIENNVVWGSRREHGVYVSNSSKNPIIRGNHIFGNAMCGIHTNGDAGMGRDGMTTGALIENNVIHDNGRRGGAGINNDGLRDSTIRNNILYDNHGNGITLYRIDGKHPSTRNEILHNTIVMPRGDARSRWCIRIVDGSAQNVFKNNICVNGHRYRGGIDISPDSLSGFVSDHNIIDGRFTLSDGESVITLSEWRKKTGQDRSSIEVRHDQLATIFRHPRRGDYRLRGGGPAVNKADPGVAATTDYAGQSRVMDRPDIGALEHCDGPRCSKVTTLAGPALDTYGPVLPADVARLVEQRRGAAEAEGSQKAPPAPVRPRSRGCAAAGQPGAGGLSGVAVLVLVGLVALRRNRVL